MYNLYNHQMFVELNFAYEKSLLVRLDSENLF